MGRSLRPGSGPTPPAQSRVSVTSSCQFFQSSVSRLLLRVQPVCCRLAPCKSLSDHVEFNIVQNLLKGQSLQLPFTHGLVLRCFASGGLSSGTMKKPVFAVYLGPWTQTATYLRLQFPTVALLRGVKLRMMLKSPLGITTTIAWRRDPCNPLQQSEQSLQTASEDEVCVTVGQCVSRRPEMRRCRAGHGQAA